MIWSAVRNIAYMFFVLVFVVGGFMIMFRHKLGGQTIVLVYNTLPNVVLGLILVTFSFAIAGFILGVGGVLINFIAGLLGSQIDTTTPFSVAYGYMYGGGGFNIVETFMGNIMGVFATLDLQGNLFVALVIMLILVLVVLFASIRIFFALMKAYIGILIDTMASPIVFAIATIPGKQAVMFDWFYRVGKNVLIFVFIFFLVNIPIFLIGQVDMFGGDLGRELGPGSIDPTGGMIFAGMAIYILFLAGNVPRMLEEYLPHVGGRTAASVTEGIKKGKTNSKPSLGSLFRG